MEEVDKSIPYLVTLKLSDNDQEVIHKIYCIRNYYPITPFVRTNLYRYFYKSCLGLHETYDLLCYGAKDYEWPTQHGQS